MATAIHRSGASQPAWRAAPGKGSGPRRSRLDHPELERLLQRAYSAERAASLAYIGHAASLRDPAERAAIRRIERDEWAHRRHLRAIMRAYEIPVSRSLEARYYAIGQFIGASCHVIGWFMPFFFAGKLESGNVCEYFVMMRHFRALGIRAHDAALYEMGMKEKEHELYFLEQVKRSRVLPWFERVFAWGRGRSRNDVDVEAPRAVADAHRYCPNRRATSDPASPVDASPRSSFP